MRSSVGSVEGPGRSTRGGAGRSGRERYPLLPDQIPDWEDRVGRYRVGFARNSDQLNEVLKLRFAVFRRELGHGSPSAADTHFAMRDEDQFDARCHHLIARCERSGEVVGTYRLMTDALARGGLGFYSAQEFQLETLPPVILSEGMELGRACIARGHRGRQVLFLLWRGIGAYLDHNKKRYLFGCTSVPTVSRVAAERIARLLRAEGHWDMSLPVAPTPAYASPRGLGGPGNDPAPSEGLPRLMRSYLKLGAVICGGPAFDAAFGTTDFFMLLDARNVAPKTYQRYVD